MPNKNIFKSGTLTLDYNGKCFLLLKEDNDYGRKYGPRAVNNLLITIDQEMGKQEHEMEYNLKEFNITKKAQSELESKISFGD